MKRYFIAALSVLVIVTTAFAASWKTTDTEDSSINGGEIIMVENEAGAGNNWMSLSTIKTWVLSSFPACDNDQDIWEWDTATSAMKCVAPTDITGDGDTINISTGEISAIGAKTTTASKATTYTIGTDSPAESYGGIIYVTSAATVTAPAVAVGMNFTVVTIGTTAISLDVNASDKMILDGVTLADGDKATNTTTAGDTITCAYYSVDGWYCWSGSPDGDHWTDGN